MSSLPPLPPSAPLPPPTQTYPIPIAHATRRSPSPYRGGGSMRDDPYAYGSRGDSYIPGGSMPVGGFMGGEGGFGGAPGGPGGMAMYRRDSFGRDRPPRDAYLADRRQHRSRSPPPHYDTGRFPPRNGRSRSPSRERFFDRDRRDRDRDLERDRDDRPRYRDDRREPNSSGGRPIDPEALENMVSFRPFSEWVRMSQPELVLKDEEEAKSAKPGEKSGMSLRFEEYKKKFTSRQLWALYLVHRNEAWFQERYSMEEKDVEARKNETKKGRGRTVAGFFAELERGEWDGIDYTEEDGMEDVKMKDDNNDKPQRRAPDNGVISSSDRDLVNIEPEPNQIFLKTIGPDIPRSEIEEVINKKSPGFEYLALSEPASKRSFHRVGWAQFSEGTDMDNVVRLLDGMELRHFTFHIVRNTIPFTGKIRYTPTFASTLERLRHDYQQAKAMAIALERGVLGEDEIQGSAKIDQRIQEVWKRSGLIGELTPEQEREIVRISLDLYIAYLRNGLNTCYYCVAPNDHQEELKRRCIRHVRRAAVGPSVVSNAENEKNGKADDGDDDDIPGGRGNGARDGGKLEASSAKWAENVDSKVKLVTAPELVNPVDYNGKSFEEESRKISQLHIKQEEATKFRCKLCAKLFKAPEFLFKHVPTKHPKEFEELEKTLPVFNAFALDPQRVQPAFSQPASVDDKLPIQPVHPPLPPPGGISTPRSDRERRPRQSVGRGGGMSGNPRGVGGGFGGGGFRGPPLVTRIGPEGHEDPRASRGQVSYKDLDAVPSGDVMGLPY